MKEVTSNPNLNIPLVSLNTEEVAWSDMNDKPEDFFLWRLSYFLPVTCFEADAIRALHKVKATE